MGTKREFGVISDLSARFWKGVPAFRDPDSVVAWRPWIEFVLLATAAGLLLYMSCVYTETYDERAHLNQGLAYLRTGNPALDPLHPPLMMAFFALPGDWLLVPTPTSIYTRLDPQLGWAYLITGRWMAIAFFLFWAWTFGRLTARWITPLAGLVALALVLFSMTLFGHACLPCTDIPFMAAAFWLMAALYEWARKPGWGKALLVGLTFAFAALVRASIAPWAVGLAIGLVLYRAGSVVRFLKGKDESKRLRTAARIALQIAIMAATAIVCIDIPYRFQGVGKPLGAMAFTTQGFAPLPGWISWIPSPLPEKYLLIYDTLKAYMRVGHFAYFAGKSEIGGGFLPYFPVLLLMKPPLALHLLLVMALAGLILNRNWKRTDWMFFAAPPLFFLGFAIFGQKFQIGIRHIFAVFPPLFLAAAWAVVCRPSWVWRGMGAAAVAVLVLTDIDTTPHQMAYFNPIAGGPENAWHWYNDSNQDWGQGWRWIELYGQRKHRTLHYDAIEGKVTGWVALSTNMLVGLGARDRKNTRWIREGFKPREFVPPFWHLYKIDSDYWKNRKTALQETRSDPGATTFDTEETSDSLSRKNAGVAKVPDPNAAETR